MECIKITKENLNKIKDGILFVLLLLWVIMPIFKSFFPIYRMFHYSDKYYFLLMKIIGVFGIGIFTGDTLLKIKKSDNKKETLKEMLPIFIFIIYMMWTLLSCLLSPNKKYAFNGSVYRKEGYLMYINYAGFFCCALLLKTKRLRKILLNIFIIVTIFLMTVSRIPKFCMKYPYIFINNTVDNSVFAQFNHYGYYLMMALMCSFGLFITEKNKILKVIYLISYTTIGYGLIFNNTFGCYLAISVVLITYFIYSMISKKDRKETLLAIIIFVVLSAIIVRGGKNVAYENIKGLLADMNIITIKTLNIEENTPELEEKFEKAGTNRMLLWKEGIKFVQERPIFGFGPDNLKQKYNSVSVEQDRPHNLIIYLSATSGIPGMIIYVTAVGIIVIRGIKKLIENNENGKIFLIVVVTYLISSMFGNSMYYTSPYFFMFLGFLMNSNIYKIKE